MVHAYYRFPGESRDPWRRQIELLKRSHCLANDAIVVRRNDGPRLPPVKRGMCNLAML
jgi:hypothetical protein